MGIISIEKADHLFWLGRYTERVFTTLQTFFKYFGKISIFKNKVEKIYDAKFLPSLVENVGSIDIAQNLLEFPLSPGLEWIRDHIDESGDK